MPALFPSDAKIRFKYFLYVNFSTKIGSIAVCYVTLITLWIISELIADAKQFLSWTNALLDSALVGAAACLCYLFRYQLYRINSNDIRKYLAKLDSGLESDYYNPCHRKLRSLLITMGCRNITNQDAGKQARTSIARARLELPTEYAFPGEAMEAAELLPALGNGDISQYVVARTSSEALRCYLRLLPDRTAQLIDGVGNVFSTKDFYVPKRISDSSLTPKVYIGELYIEYGDANTRKLRFAVRQGGDDLWRAREGMTTAFNGAYNRAYNDSEPFGIMDPAKDTVMSCERGRNRDILNTSLSDYMPDYEVPLRRCRMDSIMLIEKPQVSVKSPSYVFRDSNNPPLSKRDFINNFVQYIGD